MKFPQGSPPSTAANLQAFRVAVPPNTDPSTVLTVHPTQLYEVAAMLLAFAVLWVLRKRGKPVGWLFGVYLVFAGIERFLVEILRAKDDRFLGPFTIAQLASVILVGIGILLMIAWRKGPSPDPGGYLVTGKRSTATRT
jgi:phosphatidylglycerol---prolipoprotein diacylglyceryl transferase